MSPITSLFGNTRKLESHHESRLERYKEALLWRAKSKLRAFLASFKPIDPTVRPLFITGVMGSGTTLVTRFLDQLYEFRGVANESAREIRSASPLHVRKSRSYRSVRAYTEALTLSPRCPPAVLREDLLKYYRCVLRPDAESDVVLDKGPNTHLVRARALAEAFPEATFLIVCRHPLAAVEGLRRKWELFAEAPLGDVCRFWADLHSEFFEQSREFSDRVMVVCYERLAGDPEVTHERIASFARLKRRDEPMRMGDRPDRRGFGLRNVVDGRIRIVGGATERAIQRLSEEERVQIEDRLGATYRHIVDRYCEPGGDPKAVEADPGRDARTSE